ncbi:MAG TPA: hypothetical protein VK963_03325 [Candidatus Saccharimonadales bacterium]|nr:hypothetical protein [Candidatus Saccharimonadales bacterium]
MKLIHRSMLLALLAGLLPYWAGKLFGPLPQELETPLVYALVLLILAALLYFWVFAAKKFSARQRGVATAVTLALFWLLNWILVMSTLSSSYWRSLDPEQLVAMASPILIAVSSASLLAAILVAKMAVLSRPGK